MAKGKTQRRLAPRAGDGGPRQNKVEAVEDFKERYGRSEAVVLTEYRGLNVNDLGELRTRLRDAGAEYRVYKNTLATIAVRDLGIEELSEMLTGPTATVFAMTDPVAAAKALSEFGKEHELLVLKGGLLGGKVLDGAAIAALAKLDTREVMLAKIAGMLVSPIQSMANVLKASFNNLGSVLAQYRDQMPAGDTPAESASTETPAEPGAAEPAAEATDAPAEPAADATAEEPAAEATDAPASEQVETPAEPAGDQTETAVPAEAEAEKQETDGGSATETPNG